VAGDPLHWAHLLIGLQAIAQLKLDKVIFVMAGDDARKPNMTKAAIRHPLGRAVLDTFKPFFAFSDIAVGTDYDGETNIFRLLALNPDQEMEAFYLVGDDHYKLKNASGGDDTIPKLEKNRLKPELGFDAKKHEVSVAFIEREGHTEAVPTDLDVQFLPQIEFEASSTAVRKQGRYALMPYSAYDYVKRNKLGLYGIPRD
jgi:nicotinic acid mononucleotide adenylyltransferase